jgi:hypothetical protein
MILGALLVVSVILTVTAWISRNNAITEHNKTKEELRIAKTANVQDVRTKHHTEVRMQTGVAPGCARCQQLKIELDGSKQEVRKALASMSAKQKDELYYNYDVVAKNVTLNNVADPANADLHLIQISFTVKNQSVHPRGNILGIFRLYKGKEMTWQTKFDIATLAPGATVYKQLMAPGHIQWSEWGCQLYPSMPSDASGLPPKR